MRKSYMLELTDEELAALNTLLSFEIVSAKGHVTEIDTFLDAEVSIFEKVQRLMEGR